ncbi:hypothetical protein [Helicobacter vulpis]|uniref:hypothetical protein n=1 Tax=Helicobacter vulpis TaxID=2316076 RepID=UPI001F3E92EC|nr:hypothetical protein [Helicobacter vulpis]
MYSQNGEDGILDLLIEVLQLDSAHSAYPRAFVEFGVQDYRESNTRYLLKKRNFTGLVMDASAQNVALIRENHIGKHDLEAQHTFITRENIDGLIGAWLCSKKLSNIAILSVDIDGMDYFIWEAITCVQPAIVVVEFNAIFGGELCVSVPYRADFQVDWANNSGYFGASLQAFITLGKAKGYTFVGCESCGVNAFFIRADLESKFPFMLAPLQEYCAGFHNRQSLHKDGHTRFLSGDARLEAIKHLPLIPIQ